jgi:hypothetical protein
MDVVTWDGAGTDDAGDALGLNVERLSGRARPRAVRLRDSAGAAGAEVVSLDERRRAAGQAREGGAGARSSDDRDRPFTGSRP